MAAITAETEPRIASVAPKRGGEQMPARAASQVQVVKRFCELILTVGLLSIAAVGVIALKIAIWIAYFNY